MKLTSAGLPCIYLAGDSTVWEATPDWQPMAGWGQQLPGLFDPKQVQIKNHAFAGRSLRSFLDEGRLERILAVIQPGDWLFVQFGHNDQKPGPGFAHPRGSYRSLLRHFAGETIIRQAKPLLISPVERCRFGIDGRFRPSHGELGQAVLQVAAELGIPSIDLMHLSQKLFATLGPEATRRLFVQAAPGLMARFPAGYTDDTHFSTEGAAVMAGLITQSLRDQALPPAAWLI